MDIIGTIIMGIFVALLIGAALWLGFTLVVVIFITGLVMAFLIFAKDLLRRWRFVHHHTQQEKKSADAHVIEVDYVDITDDKKR